MVVQFVNDSESYGSLDLLSFALPCSLLNDPRFANVPKVLETAKEPEPFADIRNLRTLRRLRRPVTATK